MSRSIPLNLATALSVAGVLAGLVATSDAHFKLTEPASLANQNTFGDPQKTEPCGQDDGNPAFVPTNLITTYEAGSTITISFTETVSHPGHYRVSLAQDMAALPADPAVTPVGNDECGSTPINNNPTLPLLADGLLAHTQPLNGPQTMQVQLPAGMTCTNCVLQVTQFMSNHTAPCYYHHCATVTITAEPVTPGDAGVNPTGDAGTTPEPEPDGASGGCSTQRTSGAASLVGAAVVGLLLLRRSRRTRR